MFMRRRLRSFLGIVRAMRTTLRLVPGRVADPLARRRPGWMRRFTATGIVSRLAVLVGLSTGGVLAAAIPVRAQELTPGVEPAAMSALLHVAVVRSLARDAGREYDIDATGRGTNPRHGLTLRFTPEGARIEISTPDTSRGTGHAGFTLRLDRFGRGVGDAVRPAAPRIAGAWVEYDRGDGVREWFVNLPRGVEQGWTVAERPAGTGPLTLVLDTGRRPDCVADGELGWAGVVYRGLVALDARGRRLPSRWVSDGHRLRIEVDDATAVYPVVIDPWVQQAKLTAADGAGGDRFATSVALDGDTALVGAGQATVDGSDNQGAVYVFTRSGDIWSEHQKLTAADGAENNLFGFSVALDGDTALVGAMWAVVGGNVSQGAVYVFTRSGDVWSEQQKLTAADGAAFDEFGESVAVDGDTALVAARWGDVGGNANQGAVYVFTRSGNVWTEQHKLTAADGAEGDFFGASVALDGDTALVGAVRSQLGPNPGAAYTFTRSGDVWTEQHELTPADGAEGDFFGISVALDGDTALVGANLANVGGNVGQGAAYVFTRSGDVWTEQHKLTAADGAERNFFGGSVALGGDTALVGAEIGAVDDRGAAYVFTRSGGTWSEQQKLTAADEAGADLFGGSVALDGNTALVGASLANVGGNLGQGAAYVFTVTEPALRFEPSALDFGEAVVGSTSAAMTVTLQNTGTAAATGLTVTAPGNGFKAETSACSDTLAPGDSCEMSVTFSPPGTGPASATLTVESAEGATATLTLRGTGVAPALAFVPASHDFGEVQVGTPSGPMTVRLENTGNGAATAVRFATAGEAFAADPSACGASLDAGARCEFSIIFTPGATGAATGTLTVESAEGAMATLALSGRGVTPALTFTPASLAFDDVQLGTTSEPMTATLENTGTGAATALEFVAPGDGFEADTSACGPRLIADARCEVIVTFTPAAAGRVDATLTVESAEGAMATLDLSGATATVRYDFAEGATGYFTTTLALFNPDRAATAHVAVKLLPEGREPIVLPIALGPFRRESLDVNAALGDVATGVAAVVTADRPIASLRQMTWDASRFGSTLESGASGPSTTHYFAEGATAIWDLFYLLANDNDAAAQVTIEYLRDVGAPITQRVAVPAHARQTVWVNAVPGMANAQGGAIITADVPIAAERSMYLSVGGWPAGASSRGAHTPADTWHFAEGSTEFFDHFLLLMNPSAEMPATVDVRYQLADGQTITRRHVVPPQARRTILVEAEDPALADQLMAAMTVSSGVPIVAERATWWGPDAASWYESSASVGSVEPGTVWAIGEAWTGGPAAEAAYVLLANAAAEAGVVRVTLVYDDGRTEAREVEMAGHGRVTLLLGALFPASDGQRFSVLVESLGGETAVPIVVDVSRYQATDGRFGNAGGSTTATRIR
jgi:hypothetical protein